MRSIRGCIAFGLALAAGEGGALAQSIEPRAYSAAPVGTNFVILAYSESNGSIPVDPALPLSDIDLKVRSVLMAYARSFSLLGKSAKVDVIVPYAEFSGDATFLGERLERRFSGFGDSAVRVTMLFHGAPAMKPAEFRKYRQDLVIGASVQLFVPIGRYDEERLINIGNNRWAIKPELGISKSWGRWTLEGAAAATFYTANEEFFGGHKRTQEPMYSAQGHLIYNAAPGAWVAANVTWYGGGRTSIDGIEDDNLQGNWRAGVLVAMPINRRVSLKANASRGVLARTGNNFDLYGIALQYRWGGGS